MIKIKECVLSSIHVSTFEADGTLPFSQGVVLHLRDEHDQALSTPTRDESRNTGTPQSDSAVTAVAEALDSAAEAFFPIKPPSKPISWELDGTCVEEGQDVTAASLEGMWYVCSCLSCFPRIIDANLFERTGSELMDLTDSNSFTSRLRPRVPLTTLRLLLFTLALQLLALTTLSKTLLSRLPKVLRHRDASLLRRNLPVIRTFPLERQHGSHSSTKPLVLPRPLPLLRITETFQQNQIRFPRSRWRSGQR